MLPSIYIVENIGNGFLAIMARPRTGDWIDEAFSGLKKLGISRVISLLEPAEAKELGLSEEENHCAVSGIAFTNFPIPDRGVPYFPQAFFDLTHDIYKQCLDGQNVVIHCRAGIGRSGLISAAVLLNCGYEVDEAFKKVSTARGVDVPDTDEQVKWLINNRNLVQKPNLFAK